METAIIIVLAFMLLIAVLILIDTSFEIKILKIRIQKCTTLIDKSNNENKYLKYKIGDFKKSNIDLCNSKIIELETKYQSALNEIFENKEKNKSLTYQINKYDKCNKQIAEQLIIKNNVIEDAWSVIRKLEKEKGFEINQRAKAMSLCNKMAKDIKAINSELESIELQLKLKLNP